MKIAISKIELVALFSIVFVIAVIVIPRILDESISDSIPKENNDIRALESAVLMYFEDNNVLPENLDKLTEKPKYMNNIPNDPWGNQYIYKVKLPKSKNGFKVYSIGQNSIDEECQGDDKCP